MDMLQTELDWQSSLMRLKERGSHLFETQRLSDCRFLVGTKANSRVISAHKLLLAMASPVFERMFYSNMPDQSDPIAIPDVTPDTFEAMLKYIYTDSVTIATYTVACELCYVAKKYFIVPLQEECTSFMWALLNPLTACRAYEFSKLFGDAILLRSSMDLIRQHTMEIIEDESFYDIQISTLMDILDQEHLNVRSELDLFNAILKYGKKRGMFSNSEFLVNKLEDAKMDPPLSKEEARQETNDIEILREAVKKVRLLTLTPHEFSAGPAHSKLLHQHEAFAILTNIFSPSIDYFPLPDGFNTSRNKRIVTEEHDPLPVDPSSPIGANKNFEAKHPKTIKVSLIKRTNAVIQEEIFLENSK